ncbi:MAG: flagellar biosynthesis protein FlhB [Alphaproteobacteria bacterium]
MAEDRDDSQRTEEPTQKRLDEAREKGDVASSRELSHWFMLAAAALAVTALAPDAASDIAGGLTVFIERPHTLGLDGLQGMIGGLVADIGLALAPIVALLVAAAIASGLVQHGAMLTPERIKPDLSKLSPLAGLKRLFSLRSVAELVKGLFKMGIVAIVAWAVLDELLDGLALLAMVPVGTGLEHLYDALLVMLGGVVAAMTVVALADVVWQHFSHRRKLRMTRQELRDEHKQSEGDPHIKARLRQIRVERSRRRMMAAVPTADVVITNPTHYAVALKYDQATMRAPRVVAKGVDDLARRIRETAAAHDVAIFESPPLARALYAGVELDQEIRAEHYQAVAEIIAFVMGISRKRPAARPA